PRPARGSLGSARAPPPWRARRHARGARRPDPRSPPWASERSPRMSRYYKVLLLRPRQARRAPPETPGGRRESTSPGPQGLTLQRRRRGGERRAAVEQAGVLSGAKGDGPLKIFSQFLASVGCSCTGKP
ncbi:unnamed protein product, partial [Prorocentrum cordatum]